MKPNWVNRTLWTGDNLDIMRGMNSESVDLIYLDPPFNSNKNYSAPTRSEAAGATFKDTWMLSDVDEAWHGEIAEQNPALYSIIDAARLGHGKGMSSYLIMMAVRLMEMRRLLKQTGSIYLHCDPTASHYLKVTMDVVWGKENFRNEVIWSYQRWTGATRHFQRMHDNVLFYAASKATPFNILKEPYSVKSKHKGRRFSRLIDGNFEQHYTKDTSREKAMRDVWEISYLNSQAKERVGYPTQKPLTLLRRIIEASSTPGDMVLDPFCGCATALVASEELQRHWVGIDLSAKAADLVRFRMEKELGFFGHFTHRIDVPKRTDQGNLPAYQTHKHTLFGRQEGKCAGCNMTFLFRNFTIDHRIPQTKGGDDRIDNLQLLCGACNSMKGIDTHEQLIAKLKAQRFR